MSGTTSTSPVNPTGPASSPSFTQKKINVTVSLGQGPQGQSPGKPMTFSGLRVVASIQKRGQPSFDVAEVRVYGLAPSDMNAMSTLGVPPTMTRPNNTLLLEAGDDTTGMATVFSGSIAQAYQMLDDAPETFFNIVCWTGQVPAMVPVTPTSYPGSADVATIMASLANKMGYAFENNGVQVQLANPYFAGTAMDQAQACARAANIEWTIDSSTTPVPTFAIWPKTKTRGGAVPLISAQSGLIGYPRFEQFGMSFRCLFNPSIRLGGMIQMNSTLFPPSAAGGSSTPAQLRAAGPNGFWYVNSLTLDLASQIPNGPWFCDCRCTRTAEAPLPQ